MTDAQQTAGGASRGKGRLRAGRAADSRMPKPIGVVAYRPLFVLIGIAAAAATALWFISLYSQSLQRRQLAERQMSEVVGFACGAARRECLLQAETIAHNPRMVQALAEGGADGVASAAAPLVASPDFAAVTVALYRRSGRLVWCSHARRAGNEDGRPGPVRAAIDERQTKTAVVVREGRAVLCAAVPVRAVSGEVVGAVEVARPLDELVPRLSRTLGLPVGYMLFCKRAEERSQAEDGGGSAWVGRVFAMTFPRPLAERLSDEERIPSVAWAGGRLYVLASHLLTDDRKGAVGAVVAAEDITMPELRAWGTFALSLPGSFVLLAVVMAVMWRNSRFLSERTEDITEVLDDFVRGQMPEEMPEPPTLECATHLQRLEMLREELKRRQDRIEQMWRCQDLMSHARQQDELCEIAWHYANKAGTELLEVFRIDNSRAHVRRIFRRAVGLPECDARWHSPEQCRAYRKGAVQLVGESVDMRCSICPGDEEGAYLCIPLISNGLMIGLMRCAWRDAVAPDEDTQQLLFSYANLLAVSLDNVYLVDQLREATLRDPLTGLYNRRFLEEYVLKLSAQLQRERYDVAVLMVDFDHFKRINDDYGHETGDAVLRSSASVIARSVREGDVVCRYGGEEIAAVLPKCGPDAAMEAAERVRRAVASQVIHLPDRVDPIRVSVSIGVACYPHHATRLIDLLELADRALYEAKQAGRNRCVMWEGDAPAAEAA